MTFLLVAAGVGQPDHLGRAQVPPAPSAGSETGRPPAAPPTRPRPTSACPAERPGTQPRQQTPISGGVRAGTWGRPAFLASMSLANTVVTPTRSRPERIRPMPAKNSAALMPRRDASASWSSSVAGGARTMPNYSPELAKSVSRVCLYIAPEKSTRWWGGWRTLSRGRCLSPPCGQRVCQEGGTAKRLIQRTRSARLVRVVWRARAIS